MYILLLKVKVISGYIFLRGLNIISKIFIIFPLSLFSFWEQAFSVNPQLSWNSHLNRLVSTQRSACLGLQHSGITLFLHLFKAHIRYWEGLRSKKKKNVIYAQKTQVSWNLKVNWKQNHLDALGVLLSWSWASSNFNS